MFLTLLLTPSLAARPTGTDSEDSFEGRVRCHWKDAAYQDLCDDVLVYAEEAWSAQVDDIGFRAPRDDLGEGGSSALDVYLKSAGGPGIAWVECDGGEPECSDSDTADGFAGSPAFIVIDHDTDPDQLREFVHHEFNHVLQYATDYAEPFLSVWESTAVAAERWTDPTWTTSASNLGDYQWYPWASAVLQDGYQLDEQYGIWAYYEYGAVAWMWFLDRSVGDGQGAAGPLLWEALAQEGVGSEPDVLDAWEELTGDWRSSMVDFAGWRAQLGGEHGAEEAAFAGDDAIVAVEGVARTGDTLSPSWPPYPLGTSYWTLVGDAGDTLTLDLESPADTEWALVVSDGASVTSARAMTLQVTLSGDAATVGVVNLGPEGMDADDPLGTAAFTLSVSGAEGCGCTASARPRGAWIPAWLAVVALVRRRIRTR